MTKFLVILLVLSCAYMITSCSVCDEYGGLDINNELHETLRTVENYFGSDKTSFRTISFHITNVVGNCDCKSVQPRKVDQLLKYLKRFIKDEATMRTITFNITNIVGNCQCPISDYDEE